VTRPFIVMLPMELHMIQIYTPNPLKYNGATRPGNQEGWPTERRLWAGPGEDQRRGTDSKR
jgi:hypothetical protein